MRKFVKNSASAAIAITIALIFDPQSIIGFVCVLVGTLILYNLLNEFMTPNDDKTFKAAVNNVEARHKLFDDMIRITEGFSDDKDDRRMMTNDPFPVSAETEAKNKKNNH